MTQEELNEFISCNKVTYMTSSPGTVEFHVIDKNNRLHIILEDEDGISEWNLGTPGELAEAIKNTISPAGNGMPGESIQGTYKAHKNVC